MCVYERERSKEGERERDKKEGKERKGGRDWEKKERGERVRKGGREWIMLEHERIAWLIFIMFSEIYKEKLLRQGLTL